MTTARPASAGAADNGELVHAAVGGDTDAFAAIYDRHADRLYDFCVGMLRDREAAADCVQDVFVMAASRLPQLREPDRLASWLYAIARNEALSRIRERRRETPSEVLPERPSREPGPETLAARHELAELIAAACGGLSDRDRAVYELAYRQGLDGRELAKALGVSHTNANTLVGRLRDGIERSLGALLVCRAAKADPQACPELAALLEFWDGRFTVLMRKRVARHIDGCAVCEQERGRRVTPAALLGSVPVCLPAPAWLREQTLRASCEVPSPGAQPAAPGGPEGGGRGGGVGPALPAAAGPSWWPPEVFDTTDLGGTAVMPTPHPASNPGIPSPPGGRGAPHSAVPEPVASQNIPPKYVANATPETPPGTPDRRNLDLIPVAPVRSLPTDSGHIHMGGPIRTMLLVVLLLLGVAGVTVWGAPLIYRVWPAATSVPGEPITPPPTSTAPNAPSTSPPPIPTPTATALPTPTATAAPTRPEPTRTGTAEPTRAAQRTGNTTAPSGDTPQPTPPRQTRSPTASALPTSTRIPTASAIPTPTAVATLPPATAAPAFTAVPHRTVAPLAPITNPAPAPPTSVVPSAPRRVGGPNICQTTVVCVPANNGLR